MGSLHGIVLLMLLAGVLVVPVQFAAAQINNPPTTTGIGAVTVAEDAAPSALDLTTSFDDVEDGAGLTYSVVTNTNPALVDASIVGGTLTLTYTANANGAADLTIRATDSLGASVDTVFTATVGAVNDIPVANVDSTTTNQNTAITIDVLENDSDVDGDELTVVFVSSPLNGAVTINAGTTITYTPNEGFNGDDTFTYIVFDYNGGTATAEVSVKVRGALGILAVQLEEVTNNPDEIKNLGSKVSEAAKLLQLLAGADKEEHAQFIREFHEFKGVVKEILDIGQGKGHNTFQTKMIESQLDRMELKLQAQSLRIHDNELKEEKIKGAIELIKNQNELAEIRQQVTLVMVGKDWQERDKKLAALQEKEINMLRAIAMIEKVQNGKKLTQEVLKQIDEEINEKVGTHKNGDNDESSYGNKGGSKRNGNSNGNGNGNDNGNGNGNGGGN